ncbi:F0F1 ATP synthase subunit A [Candidatus Endomicrobiellum trichonymphae]|uniref:ATP synthase subunit a n=1 Tax=Endomicrobium trichonymphae TaxID=1408204 RepID=B1H0C1_ENDTX|nr:FoF1 ATP synthase subunit a [Candidatus Endomicrobium trichonymphae]BAG13953.1 FoF1-type ATPase subunit A [Candidatus Endomicrobium trichonymphae]
MQLSPEILFSIAGFPVTNTVIATVITDIAIIALVLTASRAIALKPSNIQNAVEAIVDYFRETTEEIAGEKASFIYPWVLSFFLFILISNLLAQFPGFESIRFQTLTSEHHGVPFLRAATSDLNFTLALAAISVIVTHYFSIKYTGIKAYLTRFITFKMFPIFLFVGILEFVNEITKLISFSFRLFGNIFAGERVMSNMYGLFPFGLPLPFIILEIMVALIQAIVFAMLTMAFMHIMTDKSHSEARKKGEMK